MNYKHCTRGNSNLSFHNKSLSKTMLFKSLKKFKTKKTTKYDVISTLYECKDYDKNVIELTTLKFLIYSISDQKLKFLSMDVEINRKSPFNDIYYEFNNIRISFSITGSTNIYTRSLYSDICKICNGYEDNQTKFCQICEKNITILYFYNTVYKYIIKELRKIIEEYI